MGGLQAGCTSCKAEQGHRPRLLHSRWVGVGLHTVLAGALEQNLPCDQLEMQSEEELVEHESYSLRDALHFKAGGCPQFSVQLTTWPQPGLLCLAPTDFKSGRIAPTPRLLCAAQNCIPLA